MRQVAMLSAIALWAWLLIGCQPSATGGQPSGATPRPEATNTPVGKGEEGKIPAGAEDQVARAKQDLANRQGVAADSIKVVSVEEVQWPDSSLGCPEPGKLYAQVITPGYRVILEVGGNQYEYHTDKGRNVVLCSR